MSGLLSLVLVTPFPRFTIRLFCSFRHLVFLSGSLLEAYLQPLMLVHSAIPLNDNVFLPFIRYGGENVEHIQMVKHHRKLDIVEPQ